MDDVLLKKVNDAWQQIAEAKKYAKLYQNQFREQADRSIQNMEEDFDRERMQREEDLEAKKKELADIQEAIEEGNIQALLKKYKDKE